MDSGSVTLLVAFAAGLVSFLSPCVLPLVPAYLGHLAGSIPGDQSSRARLRSFSHALAFVLGFSLVFVGFWVAIGLGMYFISDNLALIRVIGGIILIVLGLHTLGLLNIRALYSDTRLHYTPKSRGLHVSFVVGSLFAAGWSPCIGPTLGAIIGLAAYQGEVRDGALLLTAYSAGLGLPFLISALALQTFTEAIRSAGPRLRVMSTISGVFTILVGLLMLTNMWVRLPQYFRWGAI